MSPVRNPAVAGSFYPADARELKAILSQLFENVSLPTAKKGQVPKAFIAPHAGYIYSGPIAASAYARLKPLADTITRVILLGPGHRVGFEGLAASSATAFVTPLGEVPVDLEAMKKVLTLKQVQILDQAHRSEHSLEVHLPFLQTILKKFSIVPLLVGDAEAHEVGEVLELLWGGPETFIVISSDLSHYHDYNTAKKMDQETSEAVLQLRPENIDYEQACGRNPIQGLLHVAKKRGLKGEMADLRNSGDTAGTRDQVVGYGAYVFH